MLTLPRSFVLASLALVGACGQAPSEPDPVETLDVSAPAGDPTITAALAWTVDGVTTASTRAAMSVRNGFITVRYEATNGDVLQVIVPTRRGDIAITGTGLDPDEASVRLTRAGASAPLVGSINVGRLHLRNDDSTDILVDLDIDLRGATLTGVGAVTGNGAACLDRHSTAACGETPPRS